MMEEVYIPTLLAMHGLANETDCVGTLVNPEYKFQSSEDAAPYVADNIKHLL